MLCDEFFKLNLNKDANILDFASGPGDVSKVGG